MSQWQLYGTERKNNFENNLEPDSLKCTLNSYRQVLGSDFGIQELLMLEYTRALALVAEAINDAPEFLIDQLGEARNSYNFPSIPNGLETVADAIRDSCR